MSRRVRPSFCQYVRSTIELNWTKFKGVAPSTIKLI